MLLGKEVPDAIGELAMEKRGFTILELLIVIGLIGLMAAIALPRISRTLVGQNVKSSRAAVISAHGLARATAIQRGIASKLVFSGNTVLVISENPVTRAVDTVGVPNNLYDRYGVTVTTTRDTLKFDPNGIGADGGDTKVVVTRGASTESVEINAVGRVLK
jgi:prepilin-type N-terminal cleavage/methylation domain-containing protein